MATNKNGISRKDIDNFGEIGNDIIRVMGKANKAFLYDLWDFVAGRTPIYTGTLKYSWRMTPGRPSTYKATQAKVRIKNGKVFRKYPDPERPNLEKYTDRWNQFFLTNNQTYTQVVNDDETKATYGYPFTYNWIENGIETALYRAKSRSLNNLKGNK